MKTVLTLVDFSEVSVNALSFAAEFAKRAGGRLLIANILQKGDVEEEAETMLRTIESELKNSFGAGLKFESTIVKGNLISTVQKLISIQHPELIVMGTRGSSGLKKILIGSNTVNVIAKTKVPVLVIPEVAKFEDFFRKGKTRVVLATDLELLEDESRLDILKKIAMLIMGPKLRVLSVRPKNTLLPDAKRLERDFLLSYFTPEIEGERVTVFSNNVMQGIKFYLDKNKDTGLLAMIAHDSDSFFQKHHSREMAAYTNLPLLVLHDV